MFIKKLKLINIINQYYFQTNKMNNSNYNNISEEITNTEKSICISIQNLINIFALTENDKKLSEKDKFYEKFRITREIFYLIIQINI